MLVEDLEGKESKWSLDGKVVRTDKRHRSSLHIFARKLLYEIYPTLQILEETSVEVRRYKKLYLDFYLPLRKLCIEVHGKQHYYFNAHFHKDRWGFIQSRRNDSEKEEWCDLNNICFIVLKYDEQDSWSQQLGGNDGQVEA